MSHASSTLLNSASASLEIDFTSPLIHLSSSFLVPQDILFNLLARFVFTAALVDIRCHNAPIKKLAILPPGVLLSNGHVTLPAIPQGT